MEKPTKPCYGCGGTDWWQRPDGGWCCSRCCPNPHPGSAPAPHSNEGKYSSELLVLRDRVILGNKKLNDAWEQIKGMLHDTEEWNYQFEQWHQANEKLSVLCTQLKTMGYEDCLYLDEKGKKIKSCLDQGGIGCRVCPSR
ncbi:unnamed protein product, partial [marine sediment metagenome]